MSASVTVSIAEDRIGMLSGMSRVRKVRVSAWLGRTLRFERLQQDVVERQSKRDVGDAILRSAISAYGRRGAIRQAGLAR